MSNNSKTDSQCCPLCGAPPRFQPPPLPDNTSSAEYAEFAKAAANVLKSVHSTKHDRKELEGVADQVKEIEAWPEQSPETLNGEPNTPDPILADLRDHQESIEQEEKKQEEVLVNAVWPWLMIWSKVNPRTGYVYPEELWQQYNLNENVDFTIIHIFTGDPERQRANLVGDVRRALDAQRQDGPDKDKYWDRLFYYVKTAPLEESRQMEEREAAAAARDEEQSEEEDSDSDISAVTADEELAANTADETHPADVTEDKETEERLPQKIQLPKEVSDGLSALVDRIAAKSRRLSLHSAPTS